MKSHPDLMNLSQIIDETLAECWTLHRKLGGTYDSALDQLADMQKLGRLAESAQKLIEARHALGEHFRGVA
jgi:hypothetical protein